MLGRILLLEVDDFFEERVLSVLRLASPAAARPPTNETSRTSCGRQHGIRHAAGAHQDDCDNRCSQCHDAQGQKRALGEHGLDARGRVSCHAPAEPGNPWPCYDT